MPLEYAFITAKDTLKFVADTSSINIRFWEPLISFLAIEEPPAGDIKILSLSVLGEAMLDDGIVDVLLQQTMMLDVMYNLIKINRENSKLLCESYFNLGEIAAGTESQVATLFSHTNLINQMVDNLKDGPLKVQTEIIWVFAGAIVKYPTVANLNLILDYGVLSPVCDLFILTAYRR